MFGAITGGRKFKAFVFIFTANCAAFAVMVVASVGMQIAGKAFVPLFTAQHFVNLSIFCGGFYAGSNVVKAGVEMFINKKASNEG